MKTKAEKLWKRYYKHTMRLLFFVAAATLMILSFPDNTKYRYIYELHRPWRYNDVIAPFDFSIYKTDDELETEKDSLIEKSLPFYRKEDIFNTQPQVDLILSQNKSRIQMIAPAYVSKDSLRLFLATHICNHLNEVFKKGIIELYDKDDNDKNYELMLISGNILEPHILSDFFTLKQAYTYLISALRHDMANKYGHDTQWQFVLVDKLPLESILTPNITFDKSLTEASLNDELSKISLTQGRVLAGQKIVSTGDIVDEKTGKILESLRRIYEPQSAENQIIPIYIGESLMVVSLLTSVFLFLVFFRKDIFEKLHYVLFILLVMTTFVVISGLLFNARSYVNFIIPFTILPIILRIFLDSRLAMYMHTVTMFLISFMAENMHMFLLMHIPAGMIAIVTLVNLTRRGQIIRTAIFVYLTYIMMYVGYTFWQTAELNNIHINSLIKLLINCLLIFMSYPMIYILERIFGFLSDVTLLELSDTNTKLLRELSEKAPGTFQHSIQVANLATSVAYRLGANSMLVRAGAMYHDVGKINAPFFFTENQTKGFNPHSNLDEKESAKIVINHVNDGIILAQKHLVPKPIINIIRSHHGDSLTQYFYVSYRNNHKDEAVDDTDFRYKHPVPSTKEEVIVMMADAIEAASKSLTDFADDTIDILVDKIIAQQFDNKLYRNAPITFRDIEDAKDVFKEKLKSIYRARIKYPEPNK